MRVEFWWENLTKRDHFKDLVILGRVTSKWILKKQDAIMWTGSVLVRLGHVAGYCKHSNKLAVFQNFAEFLEYLLNS